MCAKHYENPTMLSRVTAKNVGDVFLRHTVEGSLAHYVFVTDRDLSRLVSLQGTQRSWSCDFCLNFTDSSVVGFTWRL